MSSEASGKGDRIRILVNGDELEVNGGSFVVDVLAALDLHPQTVAVEYNGNILKRLDYSSTQLQAADRLEVVRFVQGGMGSS